MIPFTIRRDALLKLGEWLNAYCRHYPETSDNTLNDILQNQRRYSPWLMEPNILKSIQYWADKLCTIDDFIALYPQLQSHDGPVIPVAVIPPDNAPLSGFHDFICILLAGHTVVCRNLLHSEDLLYFISQKLIEIEPLLAENIQWCERFPQDINHYLIHVKPDNETTQRDYFAKKDSLIRKKRLSVAVLTSQDGKDTYALLGRDIFEGFGLSNHNVRKLYVPMDFSIATFYEAIEEYSYLYNHNKYANNYDYHKSVFLMDLIPFFDNGFVILRQSAEMHVPIGCIYYEYYSSETDLLEKLKAKEPLIQQVVTSAEGFVNSAKPGQALNFPLWCFDDHKDTMKFLIGIHY
jgi:hypothetical protein